MKTLELAPFKTLVQARCGLLFEGQVEDRLRQAVSARLDDGGSRSAADLLRRLQSDPDEFQTFVNLLTINETYFFREPEQIRLFVERLVPRLLAHRAAAGQTGPLRILSAGCASGEEPYSLVMALAERHGDLTPERFRIFGGDIDSHTLDRARAGRYAAFSFRGVPEDIRQRYFDRAGNFYVIRDDIRRQVSFHPFNLLEPDAAGPLRDFDVIFYRNVSIYFDVPTRKRIQRNLVRLLGPDGLLIIGISETLANDFGILPLAEEAGLFYFVKGNPPLAETAPPRGAPNLASAVAPPLLNSGNRHPDAGSPMLESPADRPTLPDANARSRFHREGGGGRAGAGAGGPPPGDVAERVRPGLAPAPWPSAAGSGTDADGLAAPDRTAPAPILASPPPFALEPPAVAPDAALLRLATEHRFDEALAAIADRLAANPRDTAACLLQGHILIERQDFAGAAAAARAVLAVDDWSLDALLLLGLAAKWRGDSGAAIEQFRRAVYARPECWPAHYYLGDLYRERGESDLARRAWRTVVQLLADGRVPDSGIRCPPLEPPPLKTRFLCEHQLARLTDSRVPAGGGSGAGVGGGSVGKGVGAGVGTGAGSGIAGRPGSGRPQGTGF